MRRFIEVLLLAAYTPFLSSANGLHAMQSTVRHNALHKNGAIRGLLDTRQSFTFCPNGEFICETEFCCDPGWHCCADGSCCFPNTYCVLGSNGVVGCCPNGELCSGPVGDPQTIQDPTTIFSTSTSTEHFTATFTPTSTSKFTSTTSSTTTLTTILGAPTEKVGETIVEVSVLDVNITWSENWVQGPSSCNPSNTSKSTRTVGSSFTYIFSASERDGTAYYFDVANYNTKWEVFINGVSKQTYLSDYTINCTIYTPLIEPLSSSTGTSSTSYNFTIVVDGSDGEDPFSSPEWSFEFNKLVIQAPDPSSTSTTFGGFGSPTQTPEIPTGPALTAWAGRAQPYRSLLVFAGILLALSYCA